MQRIVQPRKGRWAALVSLLALSILGLLFAVRYWSSSNEIRREAPRFRVAKSYYTTDARYIRPGIEGAEHHGLWSNADLDPEEVLSAVGSVESWQRWKGNEDALRAVRGWIRLHESQLADIEKLAPQSAIRWDWELPIHEYVDAFTVMPMGPLFGALFASATLAVVRRDWDGAADALDKVDLLASAYRNTVQGSGCLNFAADLKELVLRRRGESFYLSRGVSKWGQGSPEDFPEMVDHSLQEQRKMLMRILKDRKVDQSALEAVQGLYSNLQGLIGTVREPVLSARAMEDDSRAIAKGAVKIHGALLARDPEVADVFSTVVYRHPGLLTKVRSVLAMESIVGCVRFYVESGGDFESTLVELKHAVDPFGGRALRWTRRDGMLCFYSIGPDFQDDRGRASADIVVRLPKWEEVESFLDSR